MDFPFEAYVDGQRLERLHVYTDGKGLVARVTPKIEWAEIIKENLGEPVHLYLFVTPASQYRDLEEHIHDMEGKETVLGEMPTLREYKQHEISTDLQRGFLYDLFAVGQHEGRRVIAGGGRLSTQKGEVPYHMTLDELKLFALEDLDLTPEEVKDARAKVTPMTAWGLHGRFIIAGFGFGDDYGVMVQHNGAVSHYHGYSKERTRDALAV